MGWGLQIDTALSEQALDIALKKFPEFAKFQPEIEWRALMQGGAFIVTYEEYPPKNLPNAWDFQNSYIKNYKRLAEID